MIGADICGNVNSTHLMGSRIQKGNGDFARNAYLSMFLTPSAAKGGAIDLLQRADSHVEHTGMLLIMTARVAGR
jgi:succinyl-CoA:acetate CoA-transferase